MRLNTFGSRTGGRCCETDDRPDASEAWSRDAWLVYEPRVELRRLDISVIVSPLTAIPGAVGALSFGCSRVLFSMMTLKSGRYNADIRACDDCNARHTVHSQKSGISKCTQISQQSQRANRNIWELTCHQYVTIGQYLFRLWPHRPPPKSGQIKLRQYLSWLS